MTHSEIESFSFFFVLALAYIGLTILPLIFSSPLAFHHLKSCFPVPISFFLLSIVSACILSVQICGLTSCFGPFEPRREPPRAAWGLFTRIGVLPKDPELPLRSVSHTEFNSIQ